jgi:hypothetical protein
MRHKHGPEYKIQKDIIVFLTARGWHVERIIGNAYQSGLPDLVAFNPKWGTRWIEIKNDGRYTFTKAQRRKFPVFERYNVGIWILTSATQEQYDLLFKEPNWRDYWKDSWGDIPDIDKLLAEIEDDE